MVGDRIFVMDQFAWGVSSFSLLTMSTERTKKSVVSLISAKSTSVVVEVIMEVPLALWILKVILITLL